MLLDASPAASDMDQVLSAANKQYPLASRAVAAQLFPRHDQESRNEAAGPGFRCSPGWRTAYRYRDFLGSAETPRATSPRAMPPVSRRGPAGTPRNGGYVPCSALIGPGSVTSVSLSRGLPPAGASLCSSRPLC